MKFADKFELLDAVTSGRVETFRARNAATDERVLVHVFDAPPKKPDQPTVLWVLESFRVLAPSPPGLVLEAGKYPGTTYAYLVTQVPEDVALREWAKCYEMAVVETAELPPVPGKTEAGGDRPGMAESGPPASGAHASGGLVSGGLGSGGLASG